MKIYIAGPYTKGDVALNVRNAIAAGNYVANLGHIPFIPHLSHFWHFLFPNEYDFWMKQDEAWLRECDAIGLHYLRGGLCHTCTLTTTIFMQDTFFSRDVSHVRCMLC